MPFAENIDNMPLFPMPSIAVVADAHFHDLHGDYDFHEAAMAVRPLADTARSTRVFNESAGALRWTLDDIVARGIRDVVLLGDYSDDGQKTTVAGVSVLLEHYRQHHGLRFHATVGNHDIFGSAGRHRSKRFLNSDGSQTLVTSNPDMRDERVRSTIVTDKMYCPGYPDGLQALPECGFFPRASDVHWETPFGEGADPQARLYEAVSPDGRNRHRLMDGSYLVEPFGGLWLLMIDANVFEPPNGSGAELSDSSDAGWNAMLSVKAFVFDWIEDVVSRAASLGKTLLAFSHYPVIDPLDGTHADERALMGRTGLSGRIPGRNVAERLIAAGLRVHFSGHLHVNDTARCANDHGWLMNIAVPSLVAFPGAYKILTVESETALRVETIEIGAAPLDTDVQAFYAIETGYSGLNSGNLLCAPDYGAFLQSHIEHLVVRRHLRREWPRDLVPFFLECSLLDIAGLACLKGQHADFMGPDTLAALHHDAAVTDMLRKIFDGEQIERLAALPFLDFLRDWYKLRMGSDLALRTLNADRLKLYVAVSDVFSKSIAPGEGLQGRFARLFGMFDAYASGLPSTDFTIDLMTGDIR